MTAEPLARAGDSNPGAPLLSILVPCLDEQDNVTITLDHLGRVLREAAVTDFEILVLDDASSDQTFQRSVDYGTQHPELHIRTERRHAPRRGYGAVVRHGIAHAKGTWVVPVSGDGVDPVELVPVMLARALEAGRAGGADLVQCSRYHRQADASTIPFSYRFLQFWWRTLIRVATGERLPDSTYAFKLFRRVDAVSRGITSNGFSIGPEIFFKTYLSGGVIAYVPSPQGTRRHGKSKFFFRRELFGFSYVLGRVFFHRIGVLWF